MRFTDGYWMTKPNIDLLSAVQVYRAEVSEEAVQLLCATKSVSGRGDTLNQAMLTVTVTSPADGVIRVKAEHFRGKRGKKPGPDITPSPARVCARRDGDKVLFSSGPLSCSIDASRRPFSIDFFAGGERLTSVVSKGIFHAKDKKAGRAYTGASLSLGVGEKVYGLGERFTACVKNGQSIDMWNGDGSTASDMAYKNIPFYLTNRGYGVLVESSADVSFEIASEKVMQAQFSQPGESVTFDVVYGPHPHAVLERYTSLTGRPALPPPWSFGLWLSTSFTTDYDEKTVTGFIDGMRQRGIPLSVFHFDCFWMKGANWCDFEWDPDTFPDPRGMIARLHEKGLRVCCWINPYIAQQSPLFAQGMENRYLLETKDGDVWQTDLWQPGMAIVDMTDPAAREWYAGCLEKLVDMGVDCFKTDFGERIPVRDVAWRDGSDPVDMHNRYTYLYNRTVFELLERKKGPGEALVFARSAALGSQKFPVHWNGDSTASYESMAETLRSGLSLSACGFGFWSHDISGFENTSPADVYKRWAAFGLLSSHSRLHGSGSYRVPWLFGEESCEVVREFTRLKCRLMPYLYSLAIEAHEKGIPVLRPMMMEFPGDIGAEDCETQYMLGGDLLVAPVFREDGRADFYLPDGVWTHLLTGETLTGSGWRSAKYDFHSLPLYVREGAVLPVGSVDTRPDYDYRSGVELHLYRPRDGVYSVRVPGLPGSSSANFRLTVSGGGVQVSTDSPLPYTVTVHA